MSDSAANRPYYLAVWRELLMGWLGWRQDRFDAWTVCWDAELNGGGNPWFYHEDEEYHVLSLLVPGELAERLAGRRTKRMYNDLAHLLYEELRTAIVGRPRMMPFGGSGYDWQAARLRAESVLRGYGAEFPSTDEVTAYEMRILARRS